MLDPRAEPGTRKPEGHTGTTQRPDHPDKLNHSGQGHSPGQRMSRRVGIAGQPQKSADQAEVQENRGCCHRREPAHAVQDTTHQRHHADEQEVGERYPCELNR